MGLKQVFQVISFCFEITELRHSLEIELRPVVYQNKFYVVISDESLPEIEIFMLDLGILNFL